MTSSSAAEAERIRYSAAAAEEKLRYSEVEEQMSCCTESLYSFEGQQAVLSFRK